MTTSIIYMDGFDHYGTSTAAMGSGLWTNIPGSIGVPTWGPARTGLYAYKGYGQFDTSINFTTVMSTTTVSMGLAFDDFYSTSLLRTIKLLTFTGATASINIYFLPDGSLQIQQDSTVIATSTPGLVTAQRWYFFQAVIGQTSTSIYLDNIDGTASPVLTGSYSSIGTGAAFGFSNSSIAGGSSFYNWIDDLIIYTGDQHAIGDRRVATLSLTADDPAHNTWTPFYDHMFGAGIGRLSYLLPSNSTAQSTTANISAAKAAALDIGANDFTFETMVKFHALPTTTNYASIFSRWDTANNGRAFRLIYGGPSFNTSSLQFDISTDGTNGTTSTKLIYPWSPNLNQWYHLALVRVSGQLLLFIDGQQMGLPISSSETYYTGGTSRTSIGSELQSSTAVVANTFFCGNLDETRFTNGVGRYTSAFAVPSAAFPRGVSDTYWAYVAWLMGYDTGVVDESSYARTLSVQNGATYSTVTDGPDIGVYSAIADISPDDHNGIFASLVSATGTLTMTTQPSNGDTITVGTTDGTTPAVYTFKNTLASAFDVLIDSSAQNTLLNFMNAVNLGPGIGTKYGSSTTVNVDVTMIQLPAGQLQASANVAGTAGNSIASTATGTAAVWSASTLSGGSSIPAATQFKFSRPPLKTTVIDAIQLVTRASKSDSGTGKIQPGLVGKTGAVVNGTEHNLAISSNYYNDLIDTDPDTGGDITPSTLINGAYQVNRTA